MKFQYRKRYEITCDQSSKSFLGICWRGFNTASGMRSHVTQHMISLMSTPTVFQYRKRYEITCDVTLSDHDVRDERVSIPQAV